MTIYEGMHIQTPTIMFLMQVRTHMQNFRSKGGKMCISVKTC